MKPLCASLVLFATVWVPGLTVAAQSPAPASPQTGSQAGTPGQAGTNFRLDACDNAGGGMAARLFVERATSNVGIGTTAPGAQLHAEVGEHKMAVWDNAAGPGTGLAGTSGAGIGVSASSSSGTGIYGVSNGNYGVYGESSGAGRNEKTSRYPEDRSDSPRARESSQVIQRRAR
jgi:hypothetical protein